MKYTYAYKTSDGMRHEAAMEAPSREVVFAELRKQGIKAIKVVAADGSKANGEVRGVRKRAVAALVALVAVGVGVVAYRGGTRSAAPVVDQFRAIPESSDRHQIYGDPATIQEIESGSIAIARTNVEKILFAYAIPGRVVSVGSVPDSVDVAELVPTPLSPSDPPEVTAYKQILNGIKAEAKAYLAGGGTWRGFVVELNDRQQREIEIYERTKRELESVTDPAIRDERNAALRAMGLRTIPRPKK